MEPFRFGFAEILIASVFCLVNLGIPAAILIFLISINNRIKKIEERLKDKQ